MIAYYIEDRPAPEGYTVCRLSDSDDCYRGVAPLVCFGDRQSDAFEFRDACRRGIINDARINGLARAYRGEPRRLDIAHGKYNLRRVRD